MSVEASTVQAALMFGARVRRSRISLRELELPNRTLTPSTFGRAAIDHMQTELHIERVNQTKSENSRLFVRFPDLVRAARSLGLATIGVLAMGAATSCSRHFVQIAQPIGPKPSVGSSVSMGRLVVHTDDIPTPHDENRLTMYRPYALLDSSQRVVMEVDNSTGADVVTLPVGRYTVRVDAMPGPIVAVQVYIVAGQTTEAHLDGKWQPDGTDRGLLVRGPDGSLVGFRTGLGLNTAQNP